MIFPLLTLKKLGYSQDSLFCFTDLFVRFLTSATLRLSVIAIQFTFILEGTHFPRWFSLKTLWQFSQISFFFLPDELEE